MKLYIWKGDFDFNPDFPHAPDFIENPTHTFTVYKTDPTKKLTYLNIQPYLADALSPGPNDSFFTETVATDFGEFINFRYTIDSYLGDDLLISSGYQMASATLGYGLHYQGANPYLTVYDFLRLYTIDSGIITIDSTLITIDAAGKRPIISNKYLYHPSDARVFDCYINESSTGTYDFMTRFLTDDFKLTCSGIYQNKHIMYMNKYGIFDTFSFNKSSTETIKNTKTTFNKMNATPYDFNTSEHNQTTTKIGATTWTLNTDNLNQISGEYLKDLFFSDRYYMIDYQRQTFIPLVLTETNFEPKTNIEHRAKQQYTFKFAEANEYVQNIR
ncbi:MAG: hypothetical protein V4572_12055 [Bacteroidota bacterium]